MSPGARAVIGQCEASGGLGDGDGDGIRVDTAEAVSVTGCTVRDKRGSGLRQTRAGERLSVEHQVSTLVHLDQLAQRRAKLGMPVPPMSRHLVFAGPPDTGKTTVARLYADLLHSLGVLPRGRWSRWPVPIWWAGTSDAPRN
ncbi:hypothetical protein ABZT34_40795 [Streptomyces sp. NPDC005329]|uniref:hypothetical protein n=1 Tax=Streptomyces sp. NPDC005329 TaxID=3157034 RepID=UPI0033BAA713